MTEFGEEYSQRELFGGAIVSNIYQTFDDLSDIRPVPDHQEVYCDKNSKTSLMIELLAREDVEDMNAAEHFFRDLAEFNNAQQTEIFFSKILQSQECVPSLNPEITRCFLVGRQLVNKDHSLDDVVIYMLALRLQSHPIDILITLNAVKDGSNAISQISSNVQENPLALYHMNSSGDGTHLSEPERIFNVAINSFEIRDYNLFGDQEEE